MSRPMTPQEKAKFHGWFPNRDVDAAVVTGEYDSWYNCLSWTVEVTDRWLWPGTGLGNFDTFYRGWGFVRAGNGPIAAWGRSTSDITHGSVSGPEYGPRWESNAAANPPVSCKFPNRGRQFFRVGVVRFDSIRQQANCSIRSR